MNRLSMMLPLILFVFGCSKPNTTVASVSQSTSPAVLIAEKMYGMDKNGELEAYINKTVTIKGNVIRAQAIKALYKSDLVLVTVAGTESKVKQERAVCLLFTPGGGFEKKAFSSRFTEWISNLQNNQQITVTGKLVRKGDKEEEYIQMIDCELIEY